MTGPITTRWGIREFPSIFVLDRAGVVRFKDVWGDGLDRAVKSLLDGRRPRPLRADAWDSGQWIVETCHAMALRAAKVPVEFHFFEKGQCGLRPGHGARQFGIGTTRPHHDR